MIAIMCTRITQAFTGGLLRRLEPYEPLFHSGDPVTHMFLVLDGQVALTRQTGAGASVILQRARAGQVLAEASAYSTAYHCDAQALAGTQTGTQAGTGTGATIRAIPAALFRGKLAQDSDLAAAWAAHLASEVQSARMLSEIRTLRTVGERLDAWLGEGRALPNKGQWQDVAAQLGVTREALYRELGKRRASKP